MKLTRWGRSGKFPKPQKAYTAVVVPHECEGQIIYQWVTTLWYKDSKSWYCENHEKAYLWNNKRDAEDFVSRLAWYNVAAWTVTVFPDSVPENNY